MRQIKFRGKRADNGEWVQGYFVEDGFYCIWSHNEDDFLTQHLIDPDTLGQFTGLTDSNGKEIYEGDIFTVNGKYPRVMLWDKMCWALMPTEYFHDEIFWVMNLQHPGVDWWDEFADEFEVIGNIHDNPELITNQPTEV